MSDKIFGISDSNCIDFVNSFSECDEFIKKFQEKYDYVIAYHATNLADDEIESIKKNGLCISDKELLFSKAKKRFVNEIDNFTSKEKILEIIKSYFEAPLHTPENAIFFCFDKDNFIDFYHYLLFGSESLLPVAGVLKKAIDINFRKRLVESGNHYLLKVRIAVKNIETDWFDNIYDYLMNDSSESGFKIDNNLEPKYIVEFIKVEGSN